MSTLILIRHGQAEFGADSYDRLSALGRAQAAATGVWLAGHAGAPYAVLHGPRRRHRETAQEMLRSAAIAAPASEVAALDEFAEGEEILGAAERLSAYVLLGPNAAPRREQLRHYDRAIAAWTQGQLDFAGRLTFDEFRAEVRQWLRQLIDNAAVPPGSQVVAVTSAGVICAVLCEVLGLAPGEWHGLLRGLKNASVSEIAFSAGRCGLRSFNASGHLPANLASGI